ncbi:D-threonine aldolase [bioreactor metagenome]|uniref:D-threonine aldolase n=1 Tax=bioreactor metagenome TaxID=1076179 RepID=A0A645BQ31_9ZZZZ|nr:DSD1 family PLP-dependent enzyme [Candidatus Metalachnospira sp.]
MKINDLETPALILDRKAFEANLDKMDALLKNTSMKLRPHYKSNKCSEIAKMQITRGASGITCAKLGEAEDLAKAGIKNILIANQVVQLSKIKKIAELAKSCYLIVCVDKTENIVELSLAATEAGSQIHCLVEYEVGMKRCGVDTYEEFLELAKIIDKCDGLVFEGIQAYAGHMAHEHSKEVRIAETIRIENEITGLKKYVEENGFKVKEVGGGSTGTVEQKPKESVYTDIQAGSYIFMDNAYRQLNLGFKNALFVLTTVISTKKDRVVTDTGVKSLGMDQGNPIFLGVPEDSPISMSEEHGAVYCEHNFNLNDKLLYIPGHCCTTVNIFDEIYVVDGDDVIDCWKVTGRGKAQ